jgi:hypothetical protein
MYYSLVRTDCVGKMETFLNLSSKVDAERDTMEKIKIPFRKFYSQLSAQSRKDSKPDKCFYCEHETTTFCNSHSLPAFILKNIAVNGCQYTINKVIESPLIDDESGINNSSTFNLLCRDCDSKIFRDYETPENYRNPPTAVMLIQMAMKNYLRQIGKRRFERSLYSAMSNLAPVYEDRLRVIDLDLSENLRAFKKAKKSLINPRGDEYYMFFYEKLNYVVPIAFQGQLTPIIGLEGEQINNVFNKSNGYVIQPLHVSIFPLKDETVVMLFIEKNHNRYRQFYRALRKLPLEKKLAALNYMVFCLTEDVYLSKQLSEDYMKNEDFRRVVGLTSTHLSANPGVTEECIDNSFSFKKMDLIPNFLTFRAWAPKQETT